MVMVRAWWRPPVCLALVGVVLVPVVFRRFWLCSVGSFWAGSVAQVPSVGTFLRRLWLKPPSSLVET